MHDVSIALELGDMQLAPELAPRVDARNVPVERRVRDALKVARIYTFANRREEAIGAVLDAERDAPAKVRYHSIAGELAVSWMRDPPHPQPPRRRRPRAATPARLRRVSSVAALHR
jgi:hypothetical protein